MLIEFMFLVNKIFCCFFSCFILEVKFIRYFELYIGYKDVDDDDKEKVKFIKFRFR